MDYKYYSENEVVYARQRTFGDMRPATFKGELMVKDENGRTSKQFKVLFPGEDEPTVVDFVHRHPAMEKVFTVASEIKRQIIALSEAYRVIENAEEVFEEHSETLGKYTTKEYLGSFYDVIRTFHEEAIENGIKKMEEAWEKVKKNAAFHDMEPPKVIQNLKEKYARMKQAFLLVTGRSESVEVKKTYEVPKATVDEPVTVIIPVVKATKDSADGSDTAPILAPEVIPITVAAAS